MKTDEKRKFGVSDLMILVAAVGFGLGISRLGWPGGLQPPPPAPALTINVQTLSSKSITGVITPGVPVRTVQTVTMPLPPPGGGYPLQSMVVPVAQRVAPFVPCLATLSAGLVLLALRSPRPRRRKLLARPGFVATLAAFVVVVFESGLTLLVYLADGRFANPPSIGTQCLVENLVVLIASNSGLAVGLAWFLQAIGGRWRPEKTWLDRSGRVIGVAWLIVGVGAGAVAVSVATWGQLLR